MDAWLEDEVKELLTQPCLAVSGMIGDRLNNRRRMAQEIDERALTEDFVDAFDMRSGQNVWGGVVQSLRDRQIYMNSSVRKSTKEHRTGADLGLILNRQIYSPSNSKIQYGALIQCKRVDNDGNVKDFFHIVKSSGKRQSALLLDQSPASFYFLFVASSMLETYCTIEPIAFVRGSSGCSSPVWNMGCFGFENSATPFLSGTQKSQATSILVLPALAVEAQQTQKLAARLSDLLPNCIPFWYWFAELFVPGFVGDYRKSLLTTAANVRTENALADDTFGVQFAIELQMGNG